MIQIVRLGALSIGGLILIGTAHAQSSNPVQQAPTTYQQMMQLRRQQSELRIEREQQRRILEQIQRQQRDIDRLKMQEFRRIPFKYTH